MTPFRAIAFAILLGAAPATYKPMYLQLSGVKGESTDAKHKGWIPLESVKFGSSHSSSGSGSGTSGGKVAFNDIIVVHLTDKSSAAIAEAAASGKHFDSAKIDLGTERIFLKDVIISSLQHIGASGGGAGMSEQITLNFTKIHYDYTPQPDASASAASATAPRTTMTPVPATGAHSATSTGTSMRAASASAVSAAPANSPAARLEAELTASLGPSTRSWVASEGRFLSQSNASGSQLAAAARQAAKGTFPGAPDNVIEALTFLALMDAAKANHNEAQFQAAINQVTPLTSAAAGTGIASLH